MEYHSFKPRPYKHDCSKVLQDCTNQKAHPLAQVADFQEDGLILLFS